MKKFIVKLAVFLIVLGAVLALLEIGFRAKPTTFKNKYEGLERYAADIELLMLGHSHANEGFDASATQHRSYNMAVGFQNVYFDDFILGQFIDRMDSLKCVAIAASYYHFYNEVPGLDDMCGEDLFNCVKYHLYWGLDSLKGEKIPASPNYNLEILNNPAKSYLTMLGYYLSGKAWSKIEAEMNEKFMEYGFEGNGTICDKKYLDENGLFYANVHKPEYIDGRPAIDGSYNYGLYRNIVESCGDKGVNTAIILFPCWNTYVDNLDTVQLADTRRMMAELAAGYDNCIVLDHISDHRFEEGDFHDAIHLNRFGAAKMARIIENELDSLGVFGHVNESQKMNCFSIFE